MSESYKDKLARVRDMARSFDKPSYFCIRKDGDFLSFRYGSLAFQAVCRSEWKLENACYYELFNANGVRTHVVCNDFAALQELPSDTLKDLFPQVFRGICKGAPLNMDGMQRERLWWEIERDEKRAAFERMAALRNDVRRICGQGSDS